MSDSEEHVWVPKTLLDDLLTYCNNEPLLKRIEEQSFPGATDEEDGHPCIRVEHYLKHTRGIHESTQKRWVKWLAAQGYGIDYNHDTDPPCTVEELAQAYLDEEREKYPDRQGSGTGLEDMVWCIREETGAFT